MSGKTSKSENREKEKSSMRVSNRFGLMLGSFTQSPTHSGLINFHVNKSSPTIYDRIIITTYTRTWFTYVYLHRCEIFYNCLQPVRFCLMVLYCVGIYLSMKLITALKSKLPVLCFI